MKKIYLLVPALALAAALVFYAIAVEPYNFYVTNNQFDLFGAKGEPVKIVLISDIHEAYDYPNYFNKAVSKINSENADIILIDGDIADVGGEKNLKELNSLGQLKSRYGIYAVLGNHDYAIWGCPALPSSAKFADEVSARLQTLNITVLRNENRILDINNQTFALVGLDDGWVCRNDYRKATEGLSPAISRVVMAHEQTSIDNVVLTGKNLVLSGHTHCGQIRIPILTDILLESGGFGKHAGGRVELYGGNEQYIGCGLTPGKVRLFAPPEISVIELN